jgi:hypothetical protein
MQIWLTVLAEGFSSDGWLCLMLFKSFFVAYVSQKSKQFKSEPKSNA